MQASANGEPCRERPETGNRRKDETRLMRLRSHVTRTGTVCGKADQDSPGDRVPVAATTGTLRPSEHPGQRDEDDRAERATMTNDSAPGQMPSTPNSRLDETASNPSTMSISTP